MKLWILIPISVLLVRTIISLIPLKLVWWTKGRNHLQYFLGTSTTGWEAVQLIHSCKRIFVWSACKDTTWWLQKGFVYQLPFSKWIILTVYNISSWKKASQQKFVLDALKDLLYSLLRDTATTKTANNGIFWNILAQLVKLVSTHNLKTVNHFVVLSLKICVARTSGLSVNVGYALLISLNKTWLMSKMSMAFVFTLGEIVRLVALQAAISV